MIARTQTFFASAFDALRQDLRYAVRSLRAAPVFAIAVIATLAIGIGGNTAIFSVVHGVLLRALPFARADRVAMIWETDRNSGTDQEPGSVPDFFDYAQRSRSFSAIAGWTGLNRTWTDGDPVRLSVAAISADAPAVLGIRPALGRGFTSAEDTPGGGSVVMVSNDFWHARLGGNPGVIGQRIRLDDSVYTIVGVLPPDVSFPDEHTDVWMPLQLAPTSAPRSRHWITMIGRLRDGVTLASAQREMTGIASQLEAEYTRDNVGRGVRLQALPDALLGSVRQGLVLLLAAVTLVLLIACANAASLLLARLAARSREIAVRTALGASRLRLIRQFLVESALLTGAACVIGLGLAAAGLRLLVRAIPASVPRRDDIAIDGAVLFWTCTVSLVVATAFGLLPAFQRASGSEETLKGTQSRGGTATRRHQRFRAALVTAEIALALMLVITAGLVVQTFRNVRAVNPGFRADHLAQLSYQLPTARYPQQFTAKYPLDWTAVLNFQRELLAAARAVPGVHAAALATNDPLTIGFTNSFAIEGRDPSTMPDQAELATRPVSAGYFETVGVPVLRGRDFTEHDDAGSLPVLVINEAAANRYFANQDPIGKRMRFWGSWHQIIGVVGNEHFAGLTAAAPPAMYPVMAQTPQGAATLLVRTQADPATMLPLLRAAFHTVDRRLAAYDVRTIGDVIANETAPQRFSATLFGAFALVALLLAFVGIYGVVAYSVTQRTREIGIRMALGATSGDVTRQVTGQGARLALIGSVIGVLGSVAAGRLLARQLFGVQAWDLPTYAAGVIAIVGIALVAAYGPARRAAGVAPMTALRSE